MSIRIESEESTGATERPRGVDEHGNELLSQAEQNELIAEQMIKSQVYILEIET